MLFNVVQGDSKYFKVVQGVQGTIPLTPSFRVEIQEK